MDKIDQSLTSEKNQDYESQLHARGKIVEILTKVDTRQAYSDKLLDKELKEFEDVDRRFITEIVNGVLRWRARLDWYIQQLYLGDFDNLIPDVKNNLRSSLYQLVYLDRIPPYAVLFEAVEISKARFNQKTANLVNAILRNFLRQQRKFDVLLTQLDVLDRIALKYSHPKWLVQRWIEYWGIDEVSKLCEMNNNRPRLSVRINQKVADRELIFKLMDENNIRYEVHPEFANFMWVDNFQEFRKLDFILKGWVSVQDISTGLPVLALDIQPDDLVLDMCAAPGGKSGYIAEKLEGAGALVSVDRHYSRVRLTRDNLHRLKMTCFFPVTADALDLPISKKFDKILLDAPCSGLGVLSKRVDLKWKRTQLDIENMKNLQLGLMQAAAQYLKPGGILVYSTCTIEIAENENVINAFLEKNSNFEKQRPENVPDQYISNDHFVRTFPHHDKMDGSFVARLVKKTI